MRAVLAIFLPMLCVAQSEVLEFKGKALQVQAACTEDDIESLGIACTAETPCPLYLELTSHGAASNRLFVAGNLHTERATMSSIVLASEDGGRTWSEPHPRIKHASLDQTQFFDLQTGWISGQVVGALPRDPFFLLTTDGGKTWRQRSVFSESAPGSVDQFVFESPKVGSVIIDRTAGAEGGRYTLMESQTGGESWSIRSVDRTRGKLPAPSPVSSAWRLQPHAATKAYRIERKEANGGWIMVSSFLIHAGECKPTEVSELREPPPEPDQPSADAVAEFQIGGSKKSTPKKK